MYGGCVIYSQLIERRTIPGINLFLWVIREVPQMDSEYFFFGEMNSLDGF